MSSVMSKTNKKIKKIAIAGAGGLGSNLAGLFYRYGVEPRLQYPFAEWDVEIFDDDTVDSKNLLHQDFTMDDIGQKKVDILARNYAITPIARFMTEKDFKNYDVIFCGVDSMEFRVKLYKHGWENTDLFWIDGRCTSKQGAVFNSTVPKEELEKYLSANKDRTGCLLDYEKANNISHVLPTIVAGTMLQVFLNWYRGEKQLPSQLFLI